MGKNRENDILNGYLSNQEKTKNQDRLAMYGQLLGGQPSNTVGQLIHGLILKKLMAKAHHEQEKNKARRNVAYEKYFKDRSDEARYLEEMKHKLELAKEERQEKRELGREERRHKNEFERFMKEAQVRHAYDREAKNEDYVSKALSPEEAVKYRENPKEMKKHIREYDSKPLLSRMFGKILEGARIKRYEPKLKMKLDLGKGQK
jgi:hypothetical protein